MDRRAVPRRGFSLGELLLTVALLLLLVGLMSWQYGPIKEARLDAVAREEARRIRDALEAHRLTLPGADVVPAAITETAAFRMGVPEDPWGHGYEIDPSAPHVFSRGPDGEAGTPDDITSALSRPARVKGQPRRR